MYSRYQVSNFKTKSYRIAYCPFVKISTVVTSMKDNPLLDVDFFSILFRYGWDFNLKSYLDTSVPKAMSVQ